MSSAAHQELLFRHVLANLKESSNLETITMLTMCKTCPTITKFAEIYCATCKREKHRTNTTPQKPERSSSLSSRSSTSNERLRRSSDPRPRPRLEFQKAPIFEEILTHEWDYNPNENCLKLKLRWNVEDQAHPTWHKLFDLIKVYGGLSSLHAIPAVQKYMKRIGIKSLKKLLV
jgi:hypothetical protein